MSVRQGVHLRSKATGIFYSSELSPDQFPVKSAFTLPELYSTRERLVKEKVDNFGAQNYNSRRYLEMYSNEVMLKVASVNPIIKGNRNSV